MNRAVFVSNIKKLCSDLGLKPTSACKEAGVGGSFIADVNRGQTPSVEKVETLAHFLGTTVSELIGEAAQPVPDALPLRDSASSGRASDVLRLSLDEVEMVLAYRSATPKERGVIDLMLADYVNANKKGTVSAG